MKRVFRLNKTLGFINLWSSKYLKVPIGWDLSNNGCRRIVFNVFNFDLTPVSMTIEIFNFRFTFDLAEV